MATRSIPQKSGSSGALGAAGYVLAALIVGGAIGFYLIPRACVLMGWL